MRLAYFPVHWRIDPVQHERRVRNAAGAAGQGKPCFLDLHVLPNADHSKRFHIRDTDTWLTPGMRLNDRSEFCEVVAPVQEIKETVAVPNIDMTRERAKTMKVNL